jgi:hypothetical protein
MPDFSSLTSKDVLTALVDDSSPVAQEVARLMLRYADALAAGADPHEILLPGPDTTPIEGVAMRRMLEALSLDDGGGADSAGTRADAQEAVGGDTLDAAITAAGKSR